MNGETLWLEDNVRCHGWAGLHTDLGSRLVEAVREVV